MALSANYLVFCDGLKVPKISMFMIFGFGEALGTPICEFEYTKWVANGTTPSGVVPTELSRGKATRCWRRCALQELHNLSDLFYFLQLHKRSFDILGLIIG